MSEKYVLRIGSDGKPKSLLSFDAQFTCQELAIEQWSDTKLKDKPLIMLLPATWLYQSHTNIQSKNLEVLHKSVPFAIEEELSNEVEDNYFAFQLNPDGSQDVIAIEKSRLDHVVAEINDQKLAVTAIYSELEWLPKRSDVITIWYEDDHALISFGKDQVMRVSHDQVNQLIPVFKGDLVKVVSNQSGVDDLDGLKISTGLAASHCGKYLFNHQMIDLYIDEIKVDKKQSKSGSYKGIIVLASLLLLSWLGINSYQLIRLSYDIDGLKQQQQEIMTKAYPDAVAAELVDPYAAMKSRLQLNANNMTSQQSVLLDTVHFLGLVTQSIKNVQISGLRLVNSQMEIQVSAPNINSINNFHQQLQLTAHNYRVQVGVNELDDTNLYKSIITVVPR